MLRSACGPTTSFDRLAKLDRFEELAWLVRRGTVAENDAERSVDRRRRGKKLAENRFSVFVMVDALLVSEGTSSVDACGKSM